MTRIRQDIFKEEIKMSNYNKTRCVIRIRWYTRHIPRTGEDVWLQQDKMCDKNKTI